jgi:UDP-2-acetamido-2-deoxy-ribo-hexuluronate aminotransferase
MQFIDLRRQYQSIEHQLDQAIKKVLQHGQFILGPEVNEIEKLLADFVGVKHCATVANGTDALLIAMMALNIKPGDEIISTAFTFFATAEMMLLLGAKPVFVDIEPDTYVIDSSKIEAAITKKTRAIMPVSLYGQTADMDVINAIAQKYNIAVIEDGAQSFGATYKGRFSCGLSTLGCTSFFPSKPLGCYGDGGAIFTNDDQLAQKIRELRVHGQSQRYVHTSLGVNGRFDTLQAAVLLEKMKIFEEEIKKRREIAAYYSDLLKNLVVVPQVAAHNTSVFAQYTIRVREREEFCKSLQKMGIPTAIHYPIPLTKQPLLQNMDCAKIFLPHTEKAAAEVVSLPMHPYLMRTEIESVCQVIGDLLLYPVTV